MIFALSMFAITVFHCSCSSYSDIVYTLIKNILHNLKYFLKSSRFIAEDIEQKLFIIPSFIFTRIDNYAI